jgi:hypothetical protein
MRIEPSHMRSNSGDPSLLCGATRHALGQRQNSDAAAALSAARARLKAVALHCQEKSPPHAPYYGSGYEEEPIRSAHLWGAVMTRNHYGSLILNAAHTLFIDVDVAQSRRTLRRDNAHRDHWPAPWPTMFDDLQTVLTSERKQGFRIYRTAAGFRILATAQQFEPGSYESKRLMSIVCADAAFVDLCRIQKSFRARLTPKPWRCGARRPPNVYPRTSADEQRRFTQWLWQYERACRDRATCQYLGHVGPQTTHDCIGPIIELHDRETKAFERLPLA